MAEHQGMSVANAQKPRFYYGYVIVAAALLIDLLLAGVHFTFGIFFTPLLNEFGWTRAATSGAFTFYNIFHGALFIITGRINDRFGPRLLLATSALFLGLGYILMSRVSALWQLYLFYGVLVSIGMSGGFVPLLSTVAKWFVKRRGLMSGMVLAGGAIGQSVLPLLASWLIATFEWRTAYIIVGISVFILVVLLAQLLRRDPAQVGQVPYGTDGIAGAADLQHSGLSLRQAMATIQFWQYCTVIILGQFGIGIMIVHSVAHAAGLGMSPTGAASIMTTFAAVGISARIISGGVVDRIGGKRVLVAMCLLISVALLGFAGTRAIWMLYLLAAIFGLGFGGFVSVKSPLAAQLFGLSSHGAIFGVASFCATVGAGIGPLVAGAIFDATNSYSLAFLVGGALGLCAFVLALFLKPVSK
ncbi:MAG: MFS transporter [Dehalococcoidales bacterium]|nr:MFS transporter [Dehalococcoidales bacterium]